MCLPKDEDDSVLCALNGRLTTYASHLQTALSSQLQRMLRSQLIGADYLPGTTSMQCNSERCGSTGMTQICRA